MSDPKRVSVVGAHGSVARHLVRILAGRGDSVRGIVRNPGHSDDVAGDGAEPVICDIEKASVEDLADAIGEADVVVFAAGAGPGSGAARKDTVDYGGAVKLMGAARARGVQRYLMVSSIGADPEHSGDEVFDLYLRAKGRADAELAASGLDYVIVRPGRLTDDQPSGKVAAGPDLPRGSVSRADVAAVLAELVHHPQVSRKTFVLVEGGDQITEAVASLG